MIWCLRFVQFYWYTMYVFFCFNWKRFFRILPFVVLFPIRVSALRPLKSHNLKIDSPLWSIRTPFASFHAPWNLSAAFFHETKYFNRMKKKEFKLLFDKEIVQIEVTLSESKIRKTVKKIEWKIFYLRFIRCAKLSLQWNKQSWTWRKTTKYMSNVDRFSNKILRKKKLQRILWTAMKNWSDVMTT